MRGEEFLEKMELVDPQYIEEAEKMPCHKFTAKPLKVMLAACLVIAMLAFPVAAEIRSGYVSNLFAPLYGFSQTELTDSIGRPLNASTKVGDYILSAEAVIGDRYHLVVVYSLMRMDGEKVPPNLRFDSLRGAPIRGAGGSNTQYTPSEDGKKLYIIQETSSSGLLFLFDRRVQAEFQDLYYEEDQEEVPYLDGTWSLRFTVRYPDTSKTIRLHDIPLTGSEGNHYTLHKIVLSPIGVHMDLTGPDPAKIWGMYGPFWKDLTVSMELTDGTIVQLKDRNVSSSGESGSDTQKVKLGATYPTPIPMENIRAIHVCDVVIPIQ